MIAKIFITIIFCVHISDIPKMISPTNQGIVFILYVLAIILLWGI